jgi:hypothetical protein
MPSWRRAVASQNPVGFSKYPHTHRRSVAIRAHNRYTYSIFSSVERSSNPGGGIGAGIERVLVLGRAEYSARAATDRVRLQLQGRRELRPHGRTRGSLLRRWLSFWSRNAVRMSDCRKDCTPDLAAECTGTGRPSIRLGGGRSGGRTLSTRRGREIDGPRGNE